MYWLWIPAVVLLSVFFLALCWYFFSDYECFPCPCHKKSAAQSTHDHDSPGLPYFLGPTNASASHYFWSPTNSSVASPSPPTAFTPYRPSVHLDSVASTSYPSHYEVPRTVIVPSSISAPSAPPSTPEDSPTVRLTFGTKKLHSIIYDENGIPTLDLHNMTIPEARSAMQGFLHRQRALGSSYIQIITGRGLHSDDGIAKIKPIVKNMIIGEGLQYRETCKGGAYLVYL